MFLRSVCLLASLALSASAWCVLSVSISVYQGLAPCGQARGAMHVNASGGVAPYAIQWSNGATTSTITDLQAGTYTVTVTDGVGTVEQATADVTYVSAYPQAFPVVTMSYCELGNGYAIYPVMDAGGLYPIAPATFSGFGVLGQSLSQDGQWYVIEIDAQPGAMDISYTDALGCPGSFEWNSYGPVVLPTITVSGIVGSCSDGSTGSATVSIPAVPGENDLHMTMKSANGDVMTETPCWGEQAGGWSGSTIPYSALAPGDYWVVLDVDEYCLFGVLPSFIESCADSVMFTIPDLGVTCGSVAGMSWYDVDGDCVFDPEDAGVPYSPLLIEPGGHVAFTGADGTYQFELVDGSYTLALGDASLIPICPANQPVPFTVNDDETTIDLANGSNEQLDLSVYASGGPARPGFAHMVHATARNMAPQFSGPVTLTVEIDSDITYVNAVPAPSAVVGNVLSWNFAAFGLFGDASVQVETAVPVGTAIGTELLHTVSVSNTLPESTYANNTVSWNALVTASLDPNDKIARTSGGQSDTQYFLDQDEFIDYTIRFQNTGTDTAFTVIITDTLSGTLDMMTFEQGVVSHPFDVRFKAGRVVEWRFDEILLPDSTTNESGSHGLVQFRLKPVQPLPAGSEISNTANIFFDYNEPVITEPSVLVAEFSTGVAATSSESGVEVFPNPANGSFTVRSLASSIRTVQLLSADGRRVMQGSVTGGSSIGIDATILAPGTYIVVVTGGSGEERRTRFIKH
ncbi:MAG: T9SS type A sorting domain-containing protein [Flavobacteriales bacterium]|nr:T9SS type A sorting domain-containing protein [Flavobacteriales bacterium]